MIAQRESNQVARRLTGLLGRVRRDVGSTTLDLDKPPIAAGTAAVEPEPWLFPAPDSMPTAAVGRALLLGTVALGLGMTSGCLWPSSRSSAAPAAAPAAATAPAAAPAPAGPASFLSRGLPDPALTPGERGGRPSDNPTEAARKEVLEAYGVTPGDSRYVVCRLIPPELGGSAGVKNLFPATPWFASLKVRLDKRLAEEVTGGKLTAEQAAAELQSNWVAAMHTHYVRNYGEGDSGKAKKAEESLPWRSAVTAK